MTVYRTDHQHENMRSRMEITRANDRTDPRNDIGAEVEDSEDSEEIWDRVHGGKRDE